MSVDSAAIAFQGELWLLGWRETHNGGATVTFQLSDPSELDAFKRMTIRKGRVSGQRVACVLVEIGDDEKPKNGRVIQRTESNVAEDVGDAGSTPAPAANQLAHALHARGVFFDPRLWLALDAAGIYTQYDHETLVLARGCAAHSVSALLGLCAGDVVLHHCKSPSTVGSDPDHLQKPPKFYGAALCHEHHRNWIHGSAKRQEKQLLLEKAIAFTADCVKLAIKAHIGIESLRELTVEQLEAFEEEIGFTLLKEKL